MRTKNINKTDGGKGRARRQLHKVQRRNAKLHLVFEIGSYVSEEGEDAEVRMFHSAFSTKAKAEAYCERLLDMDGNEDIELEVEEHELDKPLY